MITRLRVVAAIAASTFREAVRARVFVYLIALAGLMVLGSVPTSELGIGDQLRLITDVSMGGASAVGIFLALFWGVSAVSGEVERRTVYTIIAKRVSRADFVWGKFAGVWLTVAVATVAAYALLLLLLAVLGRRFHDELLAALWMAIFEVGLLTAIAVFFSCMTRPLLSSGLALGLYLVGTSLSSLLYWAKKSAGGGGAAQALYWLLPNFEIFDIKAEIIHSRPYGAGHLMLAAAYGLFYSVIFLWAGSFIFNRRDLK